MKQQKTKTAMLHPVKLSDQDIFSECTYGLEYIIDELLPDGVMNVGRQQTMDWMGLDDLTI